MSELNDAAMYKREISHLRRRLRDLQKCSREDAAFMLRTGIEPIGHSIKRQATDYEVRIAILEKRLDALKDKAGRV